MTPTRAALLLALAVLPGVGCHHRRTPPSIPQVTALEPDAGAVDVPRDVMVRVAFDQDLDPTSCTATTLRLEEPSGEVPALVTYEPATRSAILKPVALLARSTGFRAFTTAGMRSASGASVPPFQWEFTTEDRLHWLPTQTLDSGRLLALAVDPTSTVWVLWAADDRSVRLVSEDGQAWGSPESVPVFDAEHGAVAVDGNGRVVVAVHTAGSTGELWVTSRTPTTGFASPTLLAVGASRNVSVAANAAGAILVGWNSGVAGRVRAFAPGVGWSAEVDLGTAVPAVWLQTMGGGHVVYGQHRAQLSPPGDEVWCERRCVDPNGAWTICDPPPAVPNGDLQGSQTAFLADGSTLTAQRTTDFNGIEWYPRTRLFEWTPGTGWHTLSPGGSSLDQPYVTAIAHAEPGDAVFAFAQRMTGVSVDRRPSHGAAWEHTRVDGALPPDNLPHAAAAITGQHEAVAVWTTSIAPGADPGASVWLATATAPAGGGWTTASHVDEVPIAAGTVDLVAMVPDAVGGAIVAWSADGVVRASCYR